MEPSLVAMRRLQVGGVGVDGKRSFRSRHTWFAMSWLKRRRQTGKTRLEMETWESRGLRTALHVGLGETDVSMQVRLLLTNEPP